MKTAVVFVLINILDFSISWNYGDESDWPGKCMTGSRQSPINIRTNNVTEDFSEEFIKGPLVFNGYENVDLTPLNNGHTLKWNVVPGSAAPTLSGGPLNGNYTLQQFHLHWISEHAIDGYKYPLEIHMVHKRSDLSMEEALAAPDGISVLGVLFQVQADSPSSNYVLEEIFPDVPRLVNVTGDSNEATIVDLTRFLGHNYQSFFSYRGSLTTPNCDESVTWIILQEYLAMSDAQYKSLSTVDVGGVDNFRRLQPATQTVYKSITSCATLAHASTPLTVINVAYVCMAHKVASWTKKGLCWFLKIKGKFNSSDVLKCSSGLVS